MPSTWNSLPAHIRSLVNLLTFKLQLKSHLFQSAFAVYSSHHMPAPQIRSTILALCKFSYMHVVCMLVMSRHDVRCFLTHRLGDCFSHSLAARSFIQRNFAATFSIGVQYFRKTLPTTLWDLGVAVGLPFVLSSYRKVYDRLHIRESWLLSYGWGTMSLNLKIRHFRRSSLLWPKF